VLGWNIVTASLSLRVEGLHAAIVIPEITWLASTQVLAVVPHKLSSFAIDSRVNERAKKIHKLPNIDCCAVLVTQVLSAPSTEGSAEAATVKVHDRVMRMQIRAVPQSTAQ
jgi:hypothetical protein